MRGFLLGAVCLASLAGSNAQVITSFSPKYGSAGDSMIIQGSGFATAPPYVNYWNAIPLVAGGVVSDTQITVTSVPAGVSTGPLSISYNASSWNYSSDIFTVIDPWAFIERVEPAYGSVGASILIHGAHFGTIPVVKFSGLTAPAIANGNGTLITTYVPAGAPSNSVITVTALGGTATNPEPFTVVGPGPFIANFTPKAGSATTPVTLQGIHFTGTTGVKFNGQSTTFSPPSSDILLQVFAPSGVTTGPITVTTSQGSTTTSEPFYGPISLTGFSPPTGPTATEVVITGANFTDATSVKFGGFTGVEASFVVSSNNLIVATVPDTAPTGILVVATPAGSFPTTSNFVVTPHITGFTPLKGQAGITSVQINGTRLVDNGGGKPTVKFNGVNATVTSWGNQQVVATAPASSSGFISLTTADGTSTTTNRFYYPPQITSFTPNADPPGTSVTITGQSLIDAGSVLFNGTPSTSFTVVTNTSIEVEVPAGVTTGPITVTTPGGTASSAALYYAVPVVTTFAPNGGGPGTSVTVFGNNFDGASSVKFNGKAASFSGVINSQLTAIVPNDASTGPISVTAPAGTAASAQVFVVPQFSDLRINTFLNEPEPVSVGMELLLTIVPSNDGPATATNVTASVTIAPGLLLKDAWSPFPQVTSINTNGNPVVFTIASMDTDLDPTLFVKLVPQVEGLATNTVILASAMFDPDEGDNEDYRISTVLPAPELTIHRVETNRVRVAWPESLSSYILQSKPALTPSSPWANVPTTPTTEGDERVITEPSTGAAKFYRLKN